MIRFLFSLLVVQSVAFGCCDFLVENKGDFVVGRTMEFEADVSSDIIIFPKGNRFVSRLADNQVGMSWVGKYAFMGMDILGTDSLVDGLNEAGLSFGALWFPETEYPKFGMPGRKERLALLDIGNWILSMFSTCEEVCQGLEEIELQPTSVPALGGIPTLHFAIHDKKGRSVVIEYIQGKMVVSNNPIGVLTNSPSFDWQMKNLRNYINLSPYNAESMQFGNLELTPTGQGTGMMGIPGDWTPPSRFVRIAFFSHFMEFGSDPNALINGALHLINTVDIPFGLVREREKKSYDYTQWSCVKDIQTGALYYRTYRDLNIRVLHLNEETSRMGRTIRRIPLTGTKP